MQILRFVEIRMTEDEADKLRKEISVAGKYMIENETDCSSLDSFELLLTREEE